MTEIETIKITDRKLNEVLRDFRVVTDDGLKIYKHLPLDPQNSIHKPNSLAFEVIPANKWLRPSPLVRWFAAARPVSVASSVMPGIVSLMIGIYLDLDTDWWVFWPSLLGVICFHLGVNFLNDFEDHMRLEDMPDFQGTRGTGGSGVIQKNWIPAWHLKLAGIFCLVCGVLLGIPAFIKNPVAIGIMGALGLAAAVGYSGWPLRLKYRAFGDGAAVLLLGPGVMLGISLAAFDQIPMSTIIAGMFFAFLSEGALHANNLQDIPLDTNRKIKTLAMFLGFKKAKAFLIWIYLTSYGILFLLSLSLRAWVVLAAGTVVGPYVIMLMKSVSQAEGPLSSSIKGLKQKAEVIHLASSLLIIGTLLAYKLALK